MKHLFLLISVLVLVSCQGQSHNTDDITAPVEANNVISINMTFDRELDFSVKDIAVIPNNVAPWAGSLFVIDENNVLRRGDIESGDFKDTANDIQALAPLARSNKAGILMTLNTQGQVEGFFEINDASDYKIIPLSKTPKSITHFCAQSSLSEQRVYGRDANGRVSAIDIVSPTDNGFINTTPIDKLQAQHKTGCAIDIDDKDARAMALPSSAIDAAIIGPGKLLFTTEESRTRPRMFLQDGDQITAIDITGGLTTEAPAQIDSFYAISNSLGGAIRDGAVILADNETNRLVYISLGYLQSRLNDVAPQQDSVPN